MRMFRFHVSTQKFKSKYFLKQKQKTKYRLCEYHDYNVNKNHVLSMSNKNIGFTENLTANKLVSKLRLSCIKI
jgi:hypothetical protein